VVARGIKAYVPDWSEGTGGTVLVGSTQFMKENGIDNSELYQEGQAYALHGYNTVYVARDGELLGLLVINDPIRPNMKKTINRLRRSGIDEIIMLTGDMKSAASHVAEALDLDGYHAEVLPEEKATMVARKQRASHVMMIGDGINDAPALAFADVGVAMGGTRTDVAVESAAVTIKPDDPLLIPEVVQLGRKTMNIVRQNFTATIAINTIAMLLGAIGRTSPLLSAFIHNAATIGVVANSARILMKEHRQ